MNDDRVFERAVDEWLADGSDRTPAPAVDAVLLAVRTTPQERALRLPWGTSPLPLQLRLAAVIAVVAIAGFAAMTIFGPGPGPGNTPAPTPTPSAPSPTAVGVDTSTWIAYTSERYGFDIKRPPDWNETAANHDWTLPDAADPSSTAAELFEYPVEGQGIIATAFSVAVEPGTTADEWFDAYCRINSAPCSALQAVAVPASMDGHPGSLVVFANDVQAFVLVDDRMYVVAEWRPDNDGTLARYGGGRRLVEAFLSTMTLRSWSGPAPVASPPALAESFTSTLYGYSVEYPSGVWAVTAGTRVWIPGMPAGSASDRFEPSPGSDGFRATSALIPDGVTPDATWIGQNITDIGGECSPPSSTLGTIVIDGHEGRIRTSCHEVEATVILDSRIYMFTFFDIDFGGPYSTAGARALFEAMMASVQLTPETAVSPSPAPS